VRTWLAVVAAEHAVSSAASSKAFRGILMNTSEIADLKKLRREVAETWPENTSREMALQVLDALVCKLSQATAE
jgi:hypothetical protein